MNKTDLIAKVAEATETTKKDAAVVVDAVLNTIADALKNGDDVSLLGFGAFKVVEVPERTHRNPSTGAEVVKPAHKRVKFKAAKNLKEYIQ